MSKKDWAPTHKIFFGGSCLLVMLDEKSGAAISYEDYMEKSPPSYWCDAGIWYHYEDELKARVEKLKG